MAEQAYVRHEGLLGATFADGGVGSGYAKGKVLVVRIGRRDLGPEEFHVRPDAEITGWVMSCSCGWRGEQWLRAAEPADQDLGRRRVHSEHPSPPLEVIDEPASAEYREHIKPFRDALLAELAAGRLEDENRLLAVVGRARELGAEWTDIAAAAGMTAQAAHERWRDAPMEVFTGRHAAELAALARLIGDGPADV
ncbi:MAG TPA: hypothetical protein VGP57_10475 [Actinoplanes sp.]|jgi:hypothetical protein|nr:hypothetical protein [Actinoplanes sp.]